jgi:hypothetical protein
MDRADACFVDFGCGDGRVVCAALEVCPSMRRAIGIDVNPEAVTLARILVGRFAQTASSPRTTAASPSARTPAKAATASALATPVAAPAWSAPTVAVQLVDGMTLADLTPATHLYSFCFGMPHEVLIKLMHLVSVEAEPSRRATVRYACFVGVCGVLKDLLFNVARFGPADAILFDSRTTRSLACRMAGSGESKRAVVLRMDGAARAFFREFVAADEFDPTQRPAPRSSLPPAGGGAAHSAAAASGAEGAARDAARLEPLVSLRASLGPEWTRDRI